MKTWDRDELAQTMYRRGVQVGPKWEQLGEVTKSVWYEKADRFLNGDPWWFLIGELELDAAEKAARRKLSREPTSTRRRLLID